MSGSPPNRHDNPRYVNQPRWFRKRPVSVLALQWIGSNTKEIEAFIGDKLDEGGRLSTSGSWLAIPTLEGTLDARIGDWIVCGVKGEFYPVKPDIFEATYEEATDDASAR